MVNPYYVHPGGDYSQGLQGLAGTMVKASEMRRDNEAKQEAANKFARIKAGAIEAYKSGDPQVMAEYSLANPEVAQAMQKVMGFTDDETESNYGDSLFDFAQNPTDENVNDLVSARQRMLKKKGVPPEQTKETDGFLARWEADPETVKKQVEQELAWRYPEKYTAMKKAMETEGGKGGTTRLKEYQFAKGQGFKGTYLDFQEKLSDVGRSGQKQKTGAFLVRTPDGEMQIATGVFDPSTGALTTETTTISGVDVVSKLGETAGEQTKRKVEEKRKTTAVTGQEKRAEELITRGIASAESTATVRRALELLDSVKTGGIKAASLRVKQIFGVEGADEGELSNTLGKAVLSQLRETFGAAFTQEEGNRLQRIEASFTKSPETNRRLLTQVLRIAERTAQRAIKSAEKRGDTDAAEDIKDLLTFNLNEPESFKSVADMSDEELMKLLQP